MFTPDTWLIAVVLILVAFQLWPQRGETEEEAVVRFVPRDRR